MLKNNGKPINDRRPTVDDFYTKNVKKCPLASGKIKKTKKMFAGNRIV